MKRLAPIENFGSLNVLWSDKTGTLTAGAVRLHGVLGYGYTPIWMRTSRVTEEIQT